LKAMDTNPPARLSATPRMRPPTMAPDRLLGLSEEELAFYDAVETNYEAIYGNEYLCALIHEVVRVIKRNLKVDWTQPHREDIRAAVRIAVKRVLRKKGIKASDFDQFVSSIMDQAEALWADWPIAA
jgi:type I restriction enzyme R subunit